MPILYHFRTRGTGAEAVHISGIVRAFEKMGHPVILSSPTGVDPRLTAGASPFAEAAVGSISSLARLTRHLPRGLFELFEFLYNFPAFFRNFHLARHHQCCLIYERHAFFLFSTALVASILRLPLVVEVNELVGDPRIRSQPLFSGLVRWADRFVFRHARLIVAVSPHLARRVGEYGIPADRILVLPNAVSEDDLSLPQSSLPIPPIRQAQDLDAVEAPSSFTLGFVGWLVEWHRLDFVIQALALPEFASVTLVLIGEGPLQPALEAQARALGVRLVCAGPKPHSQIPAFLRSMDACVLPHSNAYRSPIKLFEFMAQERPVLAPRTEPVESVVTDGRDALLFNPLDIESFRAALRNLLSSSELRQSIGRAARLVVQQRHTWEQNARQIMDQHSLILLLNTGQTPSPCYSYSRGNLFAAPLIARGPLGGAAPVQPSLTSSS